MNNLVQKNIDQYLVDKNLADGQREKVLLAITPMVYSRNQNVIKAEEEKDEEKKKQYLRGVEEYDAMIEDKIKEVANGKEPQTYDF